MQRKRGWRAAVATMLLAATTQAGAPAPVAATPAPVASWALKTVPILVNDVVYDLGRDVLLATVSERDPSVGNELVELDPRTGALGRHVFVGSHPNAIALTDDGTTAYVGLEGTNRVIEVDLATFRLAGSFSLGGDAWSDYHVGDMEAVPGRRDRVVVALSRPGQSYSAGVWVLDDGVVLPDRLQRGPTRIEVADASTAYGMEPGGTDARLHAIALGASGATTGTTEEPRTPGLGGDIEYALGRLYAESGLIIDPGSRATVATFDGPGLIEVTPADNRLTTLRQGRVTQLDARTGAFLDAHTFDGLTGSPRTLVGSADGFAVATGESIHLLGPHVGGGSVTLPTPPPSTISDLVASDPGVAASDLEYDEVRDRLYASVSSEMSPYGDEVVMLDPTTGVVLDSLRLGGNPGPLALSDDRSTLVVGLRSGGAVATIDLETFEHAGSFSVGATGAGEPLVPWDVAVQPGTMNSVAVSRASWGVAIYVDGVQLPDVAPSTSWLEFADASTLYGGDGGSLASMVVDAAGVRRTSASLHTEGLGNDARISDGLLYGTGGTVFEPSGPYALGRFDARGPMVVSPSARRAYFAQDASVREFDLDTYRPVAALEPAFYSGANAFVATRTGFAIAVMGLRVVLLNRLPPAGDGRFSAVEPARILDTRFGTGAPRAPLGPASTIEFQVTGFGGVPTTGVSAVALNLTAVDPTAMSFLSAWPAGRLRPLAAALTTVPGQTSSNLVMVGVGGNGKVSIYNHAGLTHAAADVAGWYGVENSSANGRFHPLSPARVLDTRAAVGAPAGAVVGGSSIDFEVTGRGGVPATGVSAVVLNLTAVAPTENSFVTAWPAGTPRPLAANLNVVAGQTRTNLVVVKIGSGGRVSLYNHVGSTHLGADVAGWYGEADTTGGRFHAVPPSRLLDTRSWVGTHVTRPGPGGVIYVRVGGRGGVPPTGVSAVAVNLTALGPTASSFLTAWPVLEPRPLAANLNFSAGQTLSGLVVVKAGPGGSIDLYNHAGSVDVAVDVAGWFTTG